MSFQREAEDLLDSIRVRSEMDALCGVWRNKKSTDKERAIRLAAFLKVLSVARGESDTEPEEDASALRVPKVVAKAEDKAKARALKRLPAMQAIPDDDRPLTAAQVMTERQKDKANTPPDPYELYEKVYKDHIDGKARLKGGLEVCTVPLRKDGWNVSVAGLLEHMRVKYHISPDSISTRILQGQNSFEVIVG